MKSKWRTEPLRDIVSYIAKGIPPSYAENEDNNTIRVLNQKCNRDYNINYSESRLHDLSKRSVPREKYLRDDDILINSTGTGTAGRIAQIHMVPHPTIVDGHMIVIRGNEKVTPRYLGYALKAQQASVLKLDEGSTGQTELNRDRLLAEIVVSYPISHEEQVAIAATLFALDARIAENRKINHHLEQMAKAIFKSWFVNFEPFGGVMPEDWWEAELGEIATLSAGGDKPAICSPTPTDECIVPVFSNGIDNFGLYGYTDRPKITEESVTVSARGTIGFVCLRQDPFVPIVRLVTAIPNNDFITAKYLYLFLSSIHIAGVGTTQQQLTVPDFKKYRILVPSIKVVRDFTNTVEPMFDAIWHKRAENIRLAETRDSLLPRLMSGELSLADIDNAK